VPHTVEEAYELERDDERGGEIFGDIPETLPSTLYAKKILKRAGRPFEPGDDDPGNRLLAAVRDSLDAGADPELALRQAADRFRAQVEAE
jgi:hypothetical protein